MKPSCDQCRYWEGNLADVGECHRHAPQPSHGEFELLAVAYLAALTGHFIPGNELAKPNDLGDVVCDAPSWWPGTSAADWCGDFEATRSPQEEDVA